MHKTLSTPMSEALNEDWANKGMQPEAVTPCTTQKERGYLSRAGEQIYGLGYQLQQGLTGVLGLVAV